MLSKHRDDFGNGSVVAEWFGVPAVPDGVVLAMSVRRGEVTTRSISAQAGSRARGRGRRHSRQAHGSDFDSPGESYLSEPNYFRQYTPALAFALPRCGVGHGPRACA